MVWCADFRELCSSLPRSFSIFLFLYISTFLSLFLSQISSFFLPLPFSLDSTMDPPFVNRDLASLHSSAPERNQENQSAEFGLKHFFEDRWMDWRGFQRAGWPKTATKVHFGHGPPWLRAAIVRPPDHPTGFTWHRKLFASAAAIVRGDWSLWRMDRRLTYCSRVGPFGIRRSWPVGREFAFLMRGSLYFRNICWWSANSFGTSLLWIFF